MCLRRITPARHVDLETTRLDEFRCHPRRVVHVAHRNRAADGVAVGTGRRVTNRLAVPVDGSLPHAVANSTAYGLSSGVVTTNLHSAVKAIKALRCRTVNINEVPGVRIESSPFGGIKDSGLGVKEGVIEAIKAYTFAKTFSLPW